MASRRTAKIAEAVRQVVSNAILFGVRDPRVKNVTVLNVAVAPDLRTAKVYVSILGDEKAERLSLQGLNAARGWIQSKIADELQLRLTPVLTFIVDHGIKKSIEISRMLRELQPPSEDEEQELDDQEFDDESDSPADENEHEI